MATVSETWSKIPIFISSTFRDMHAERDHLTQTVFPELQERLKRFRCFLEPVDLRWGVETTSLAEIEQKNILVLRVCAEEIERCRPLQIVLIGQRYGSIPPDNLIRDAAERAGITEDLSGRSVTAFEVEIGLRDPGAAAQRCYAYYRAPLEREELPGAEMLSDADPESVERLAELKAFLNRVCPGRTRTYPAKFDPQRGRITGLETFGQMVSDDLWNEVSSRLPDLSELLPGTWQEKQFRQINDSIANHLRQFQGRNALLARISAFLTGGSRADRCGWCFVAEAGQGKSALFSKVVENLRGDNCLTLVHFCADVENGGSVEMMLRRWVEALAGFVDRSVDLSAGVSPQRLDEQFAYLLEQAAEKTRVVIVLDAVDRLEGTDRGRFLAWLPWTLHENVRVIASGRSGDATWSLDGRERWLVEPLPALERDETAAIIDAICAKYHRTLNGAVRAALLRRRDGDVAPTALWLTIATEYVNRLEAQDFLRAEQGSETPPELRVLRMLVQAAEEMPADLSGAYGWLIERARQSHGREALLFVSLFAAGNLEWRDHDLRALMGRLTGREWSTLDLATLRRLFRDHLTERGDGTWALRHSYLRSVIEELDASLPVSLVQLHQRIAEYLEALSPEDPIRQATLFEHYLAAGAVRSAALVLGGDEVGQAIPFAIQTVAAKLAEAADASLAKALLFADGVTETNRARIADRLEAGVLAELARAGATKPRSAAIAVLISYWRMKIGDRPGDSGPRTACVRLQVERARALEALDDNTAATAEYKSAIETLRPVIYPGGPKPLQGRPLAEVISESETGIRHETDLVEAANLAAICWCEIGDSLARSGRGGLGGAEGAYAKSQGTDWDETTKAGLYGRNPLLAQSLTALLHARLAYGHMLKGASRGVYLMFEIAAASLKQIAVLDPSNHVLRRELALVQARQGQALQWVGAPGAAVALGRRATDAMAELVKSDPSRRSWQVDLAYFEIWSGDALLALGRTGAAQLNYRRARRRASRIAASDPVNKEWRAALAEIDGRPIDEVGDIGPESEDIPVKWDFDPAAGMRRVGVSGAIALNSTDMMVNEEESLDPKQAERRRHLASSGPRFGDWQNTLGGANAVMRKAISDGGVAEPLPDLMARLARDAEAGDAEAAFELGVAYRDGDGVARDDDAARKWIAQAAERGVASAQYNFGVMLRDALGGEPDQESAVGWWRRAAEAGLPHAQYALGEAYSRGAGIVRDDQLAAEWMRKAAQQGMIEAEYNYGVYLSNGFGTTRDLSGAAEWFERAAAKGFAAAQSNLAEAYREGAGVNRDVKQAAKWMLKAAEQGLPAAQHSYGVYLLEGVGVERDPNQAVAWFTRAALRGEAHSQYNLSEVYSKGLGVQVDAQKAALWVRKAADQGLMQAEHGYGVYLTTGFGVARDPSAAAEWFERAARQGYAPAQYNLGGAYRVGVGVNPDPPKAAEWMRKAAEQGLMEAEYDYGTYLDAGLGTQCDPAAAAQWFERAANKGFPPAQYNLANAYYAGVGVPRDVRRAIVWARRAAEQGMAAAQYNCGWYLTHGLGAEGDPVEARQWLERAAAQGIPEAERALEALLGFRKKGLAATVAGWLRGKGQS